MSNAGQTQTSEKLQNSAARSLLRSCPRFVRRSVAVIAVFGILITVLGLSAAAATPSWRPPDVRSYAAPATANPPCLPPEAEAEISAAAALLLDEEHLEQTNLLLQQQTYNWYMQKGKVFVMSACARIAYLQDILVGGKCSEIGVMSKKIRPEAKSSIPESPTPFRLEDLKVADLLIETEPLTGTHWTLVLDPHDPEGIRILELQGDHLQQRVLSAGDVVKRGQYVLTRYYDADGADDADEQIEPAPQEAAAEPVAEKRKPCFRDVSDPKAPYYDAVYWAVEHKPYAITAGLSPEYFGVDVPVSRAMSVTFLWASKGRPSAEAKSASFTDVRKTDWFFRPVAWAVDQKITAGVDETHFGPHKTCNRAEFLTFLYAAASKPRVGIASPYCDVKNQWYARAAIWAWNCGIEKGENGNFNATVPCTRASVVLYLYRAMS